MVKSTSSTCQGGHAILIRGFCVFELSYPLEFICNLTNTFEYICRYVQHDIEVESLKPISPAEAKQTNPVSICFNYVSACFSIVNSVSFVCVVYLAPWVL